MVDPFWILTERSRRALPTTDTDDALIAKAAKIGPISGGYFGVAAVVKHMLIHGLVQTFRLCRLRRAADVRNPIANSITCARRSQTGSCRTRRVPDSMPDAARSIG